MNDDKDKEEETPKKEEKDDKAERIPGEGFNGW